MACRLDNYPYDFDASLRYTRDSGLRSTHPYPYIIGAVNGILPLFDARTIYQGGAETPWGVTAGVLGASDVGVQAGMVTSPDLLKVRG